MLPFVESGWCPDPGDDPANRGTRLLVVDPQQRLDGGADPTDDALAVDSELLLPGKMPKMPPQGVTETVGPTWVPLSPATLDVGAATE